MQVTHVPTCKANGCYRVHPVPVQQSHAAVLCNLAKTAMRVEECARARVCAWWWWWWWWWANLAKDGVAAIVVGGFGFGNLVAHGFLRADETSAGAGACAK